MKDKILALARGEFEFEPVKLQLSKKELRLVVVSDREVSDTFTISNVRGTKVKGFITAKEQVTVEPQTFLGEETEITVTFSAQNMSEGSCIKGELCIITDCGEEKIPYTVEVKAPVLADKKGEISDFHVFQERIDENPEDAALLFHSPAFKNVLLYRNQPDTFLYEHLVKRNSKLHSLDEFMVATGRKKTYHFRISQTRFEYDLKTEDVKEKVTLLANTWGAACIHVYTNDKFIEPETDVIWSDDFEKDKFELNFKVSAKRLKDGKHIGKLYLKTPYQKEEITVIVRKKTSIMPVEDYIHEKKYLWAVYRNYLNYKMGRIREEEYLNNIKMALDELSRSENPVVCYLRAYYQAKMNMIEDCEEFAGRVAKCPRPEYSADAKEVIKYLLGLYIKSIYTKSEEDKKLVALEARDYYENGYHLWPIFYLLMQVEERYQTLPPKLLLEEVNVFLDQGCHSPLLYLEAVKIYQKDSSLLHQLTKTNIQVLYWGTKEELFDKEFAVSLSFLAEHIHTYSEVVYRTLLLQYKKYRLDDTLHSICSMLIRCEKMEREYFPWFALGVQKRLRITELFEYYMYTFGTESEEKIPQTVITYFQYENHLNDKIKAYLYARIIKDRLEKPDNFTAYEAIMRAFAIEQVKAKKMNKNLGVLYETLLKRDDIKDEIALCLPEIMFKQHLICKNENMEGVYIVHLETEEAKYYPIIGGQAHVDIYTPNYQVYFVDSDNRYYVKTVDYKLSPMMNLENFAINCFENGSDDEGLLLHLLSKIQKRFNMKQQDAIICHMITKKGMLCDYYQGKTVLSLFDYYEENHDDGILRQLLEEMDLSVIKDDRRSEMIECMITFHLSEKAYEAVEAYGYRDCDKKRLLEIVQWKIRQEDTEYDSLLLNMCHYLYENGTKSDETVGYLQQYFMGPLKQVFEIFSDSWLKELPIEDEVCEKLLAQVLFVGENPTSYYQIFYDYYVKGINRILVKAFLSYIAYQYIVEKVDITEDILLILQKEAASTDSRVMHLAILKRYTKEPELRDEQKEYIDYHVSRLVKEGIIMKFMQEFKGKVTLPYIVENSVLIEYHINTKLPVNLLVHNEEGETKTYQMKEVFPGVFVKEFLLFAGEEFRYQVYAEETGKKTRRAPLKANLTRNDNNSFYSLVNHMLETKDTEDYQKACLEYEKYQQISKALLRPIL